MTTLNITGGTIIGAVAPLRGNAPFHRAPIVIATAANELLRISRYSGEFAEGEQLDKEEWQALIDSNEAIPLPCMSASSNVWLWVLRRNFLLDRERLLAHLRNSSALQKTIELEEGVLGHLVNEAMAAGLRDALANEAARQAEASLRARDAERAVSFAEAAFNLQRTITPRSVALLASGYRMLQRSERADGYLELTGRSLGGAFRSEVQNEISAIESTLELSLSAREFYVMRTERSHALKQSPLLRRRAA
jgi:hypothetical protein